MGHEPQRAARAVHALQPDVVDDRQPACAGSTRTRAGSGCSSAGRLCTRARRSTRAIAFSFHFRSGHFSGSGPPSRRAARSGAHCIPAGGMSSQARLSMIETLQPTVICCTPTYALRLLEVAGEMGGGTADLSASSVRVLIVAGEAGGSIPSTRQRIEQGWGARVIDHHGLTEVGPISFECWEAPGALHLNEAEYICEILEPGSERAVADGERGELVVTNLGRVGQPADSLSHRRRRRAPLGDVRVRAQCCAARGRHSRAARRHGERARRQRVSVCRRSGRAALRRSGRISRHRRIDTDRCASCRSRSS